MWLVWDNSIISWHKGSFMSITSPNYPGNFLNVLVSHGTRKLIDVNIHFFSYFNPNPNPPIQTAICHMPSHPTTPLFNYKDQTSTWEAYLGTASLPLFLWNLFFSCDVFVFFPVNFFFPLTSIIATLENKNKIQKDHWIARME